jgi:CRP/FNR family transcriptional regulator
MVRCASEGQTAFRWQGHPHAFVLITEGRLKVHFRTTERHLPWAQCRVPALQDCIPITAAILSEQKITVDATCLDPARWVELSAPIFVRLVHDDQQFRKALFANHARRLPMFFARVSRGDALSIDNRLADWLLAHAQDRHVTATHGDIARDLLTAREVVSRKLRSFARKGWIIQQRGKILLDAPAALSRMSRESFSPTPWHTRRSKP